MTNEEFLALTDEEFLLYIERVLAPKPQCTKDNPCPQNPDGEGWSEEQATWEHPDEKKGDDGCCATVVCPWCGLHSQSCSGVW